MIKKQLILSVALGTSVAGLGLNIQPVSAAVVVFTNTSGATFGSQMFAVEGRVGSATVNKTTGAKGLNGDYEIAVGEAGANFPLTSPQIGQLLWSDGVALPWDLTWDKTTGTVTFNIGFTGNSASLTYDSPFDGTGLTNISLLAKSITNSKKVSPETLVSFDVDKVNGLDPYWVFPTATNTLFDLKADASSPLGSGSDVNQLFFTDPRQRVTPTTKPGTSIEVTSMQGTIMIDWPDDGFDPQAKGARSHVTFQMIAYAPEVETTAQNQRVATPEPTSILGLLAAGLLGTRMKWPRKTGQRNKL